MQRLGDWLFDSDLGRLRRGPEECQLEPKEASVLAHLAEAAPNPVNVEALLDRSWPGVVVSDNSVHQVVARLRRALGDSARNSTYIETLPKRGYRLLVFVADAEGHEAAVRQRGYRAIGWTSEPTAPAAAANATNAQRPLAGIAVMPFDDLSPSGDQTWLAQGIPEELIEFLGRIPELRVPSRTSTAILKQQQVDAETVGNRLGVSTLVNGSIWCIGDRLRVVVQWIRIADHRHLWSARFERKREDLLEIQKEIAVGISEAIRKELGIHDTVEFVSRSRYQTFDVRAWEAFLKGFMLVFTFQRPKMTEGREYLKQALEIDPDYLEARAWLAWSEHERPDERNEGAIRVLEAHPSHPVALTILIEDSETQWDFETAEKLWSFAAANNPLRDQRTRAGFHLFSCLGAREEALEVSRRGVRLDPLFPAQHLFLGLAHLNLRDPAAAIEPIHRAIALKDQIGDVGGLHRSWLYQYLAIAYQRADREPEAIHALLNGFPRCRKEIARGAATGGWRGANLALSTFVADSPEGHHDDRLARRRFRAAFLASAGEKELMYGQLSELMDRSEVYAVRDREAMRSTQLLSEYLRANAEFQPYWEEPAFKALRQRLDERIAKAAGVSGYAGLIRST
jgi:TolB-like protein